MVRLKGGLSSVPLRSLGDGMTRLFEVAVGLSGAGSRAFLVDEIDTGLHYTALEQVWRLVFSLAADLDVQVFATTHSWECIAAFQRAAQADPAEGVLVRLEKIDDTILAESVSGFLGVGIEGWNTCRTIVACWSSASATAYSPRPTTSRKTSELVPAAIATRNAPET